MSGTGLSGSHDLSHRSQEGESSGESDQGSQTRGDHGPREKQERRSQARGLLLLALLVLLFGLLRAGLHRVFTTGWWRLW